MSLCKEQESPNLEEVGVVDELKKTVDFDPGDIKLCDVLILCHISSIK